MPDTVVMLKRYARHINARYEMPPDPLPLEQAMAEIRHRLTDVPTPFARVALAVWLYKKLTSRDPQLITVVNILNYDPESVNESPEVHIHLSQKNVIDAIHALQQKPEGEKAGKGILVPQDEGNRVSLNLSLEAALNKL